jgi:hypothetical protein
MLGNVADEGSVVTFPLSPGNFVIGKIEKISTGLDGMPPMAFINITFPLPIHSNGLVQGILVVKQAEQTVAVE